MHGTAYGRGLLLFCVLLSVTLYSQLHRLSTHHGDFRQFIEDGELAIQTRQLGSALPLEYPPTAQPLFMLMAVPPPRVALVLWWLLNAFMYWQSAVWMADWFEDQAPRQRPWRELSLIAIAVVGVWSDLCVGQLTGLTLFCVTGSFELDRRGRPLLAGALLAISLLVKPLPVILVPYFLVKRRWHMLGWAAAVYMVLGPIVLAALFGIEQQRIGWSWFLESTAHQRSPIQFFQYWAAKPGARYPYYESGLASTLVRLFMNVSCDKGDKSVHIATLPAYAVFAIWLALVASPFFWAMGLAIRGRRCPPGADVFVYASLCGVMMLTNPKFISYWLAVPMICAAPIAAQLWRQRQAGKSDFLSLAALLAWLAASATVGWPAGRAAGSFVIGIGALTLVNLIHATRRIEPQILNA